MDLIVLLGSHAKKSMQGRSQRISKYFYKRYMVEVRPGGTGRDVDNVVHIVGYLEKIFIELPE